MNAVWKLKIHDGGSASDVSKALKEIYDADDLGVASGKNVVTLTIKTDSVGENRLRTDLEAIMLTTGTTFDIVREITPEVSSITEAMGDEKFVCVLLPDKYNTELKINRWLQNSRKWAGTGIRVKEFRFHQDGDSIEVCFRGPAEKIAQMADHYNVDVVDNETDLFGRFESRIGGSVSAGDMIDQLLG